MLNNKILEILTQAGIIITSCEILHETHTIVKGYKEEFPFYTFEINHNNMFDNFRLTLSTTYKTKLFGINLAFNYGILDTILPLVLHNLYDDLNRQIQTYERQSEI